jgi:hypothetical protein
MRGGYEVPRYEYERYDPRYGGPDYQDQYEIQQPQPQIVKQDPAQPPEPPIYPR